MYGARFGVTGLVAEAELHVLIESEEMFFRTVCVLSKDLERWRVEVGVTVWLRVALRSDFPSADLGDAIAAGLFAVPGAASFTLELRNNPSEDFDLFTEMSLEGVFLLVERVAVDLGVADEKVGEIAFEAVPPSDCGLFLGAGAAGDVKDAGETAA